VRKEERTGRRMLEEKTTSRIFDEPHDKQDSA